MGRGSARQDALGWDGMGCDRVRGHRTAPAGQGGPPGWGFPPPGVPTAPLSPPQLLLGAPAALLASLHLCRDPGAYRYTREGAQGSVSGAGAGTGWAGGGQGGSRPLTPCDVSPQTPTPGLRGRRGRLPGGGGGDGRHRLLPGGDGLRAPHPGHHPAPGETPASMDPPLPRAPVCSQADQYGTTHSSMGLGKPVRSPYTSRVLVHQYSPPYTYGPHTHQYNPLTPVQSWADQYEYPPPV